MGYKARLKSEQGQLPQDTCINCIFVYTTITYFNSASVLYWERKGQHRETSHTRCKEMLQIAMESCPFPLTGVLVPLYIALSQHPASPAASPHCRGNKLHTSSALNLGTQTGSSRPFSAYRHTPPKPISSKQLFF